MYSGAKIPAPFCGKNCPPQKPPTPPKPPASQNPPAPQKPPASQNPPTPPNPPAPPTMVREKAAEQTGSTAGLLALLLLSLCSQTDTADCDTAK